MMKWAGRAAYVGQMRKLCRVVVEKIEGNRTLGRPRHRLEENI
jgi:hypothetical protein